MNGGTCVDENTCHCEDDFSGRYCENEVRRVPTIGSGTPAAVAVPVFLIVLIILSAGGVYFYYRRKQGM